MEVGPRGSGEGVGEAVCPFRRHDHGTAMFDSLGPTEVETSLGTLSAADVRPAFRPVEARSTKPAPSRSTRKVDSEPGQKPGSLERDLRTFFDFDKDNVMVCANEISKIDAKPVL